MGKNNVVASIDVGNSKICTVIANMRNDEMQVLGVGVAPSRGLAKGIVTNYDQTREAIKESVHQAERGSGLKVSSAYVGVSGRHLTSTNSQGVVAISRSDRLVSPNDLGRVLASARNVAVHPERQLLHVIPRRYSLDGYEGIKSPVGMHGFRLDVETHIITAETSSVQNLVKCVRAAGVEVEDLICNSLAASEAVLTPDEKEMGVLMADIGHGTTNIAIFKESNVWHTTVLPVGGYQITKDIALGLGVPMPVAEEIKRRYATLAPEERNTRAKEQEKPAAVWISDGHSVLQKDLNEIVSSRIEEIIAMVLSELPRSDYRSIIPAGMVLAGGTANLPQLDAFVRDLVQVPARVGTARGVYGISDILQNPAYGTAVGLAFWGIRNTADEGLEKKGLGGRLKDSYKNTMFNLKSVWSEKNVPRPDKKDNSTAERRA